MNENRYKNEMLMEQDAIDLRALLGVWVKKLPLIILVVVLCAAAGFGITKLRMKPMYSSDTKVYVLVKQEYQDEAYIDFSTSSLIADDLAGIIVSRPIMEEVIDILGLDTSPEALAGQVSVEAEEYARIITLRVIDSDPERARNIANTVREVASVKIADIMKMDAISTVEEANLPTPYYTMDPNRSAMIAAAGGLIAILLILALRFWLDDSVRTREDIEKYLGLTVLAVIPKRDMKQYKKNSAKKDSEKKDSEKKDSVKKDKQSSTSLSFEETKVNAESTVVRNVPQTRDLEEDNDFVLIEEDTEV